MTEVSVMQRYGLCDQDFDCERGFGHTGDCGPKHPDCQHRGPCNREYEEVAA